MSHLLAAPIPIYLVASIALLAIGPLLFGVSRRRPHLRVAVQSSVAGVVAGLVFVETLPEAVAGAGFWALLTFALGIGLPHAFERWNEGRLGVVAALLAVFVLGVHAITDGLALAVPSTGEGHGLAMAVVLHHIPEGAAVWWLLRGRGPFVGPLALLAIASFTVFGFLVGDVALPIVGGGGMLLFQAFVSGLLVHLVFEADDDHAAGHGVCAGHGTTGRSGFGWLAAGASLVVFAHVFGGDHHAHEHDSHADLFTIVGALALCGTLFIARQLGRIRRPER